MNDHFNKLTPAEAERLAFLAEECAEVVQAVGKILRHGYDNHHPDHQQTNRKLLETELGHVSLAMGLLLANHDISQDAVTVSMVEKGVSISKWLHHQGID